MHALMGCTSCACTVTYASDVARLHDVCAVHAMNGPAPHTLLLCSCVMTEHHAPAWSEAALGAVWQLFRRSAAKGQPL